MAIINPIRYQIFDEEVPTNRSPIAEINTGSTASGTVTFNVKALATIDVVNPQSYLLTMPTKAEKRWIRIDPELYQTYGEDLLYYTTTQLSTNQYQLTWNFDPSQLSGIVHGQYYSVEFYINRAATASTKQSRPDAIVKIWNWIDTTQ